MDCAVNKGVVLIIYTAVAVPIWRAVALGGGGHIVGGEPTMVAEVMDR